MAALATTSSLSNYPRLTIAQYRDQLRQSGTASSIDLAYSYRGKAYRYSIELSKTAPHYGGSRYWFRCPSCSNRVAVLYCAGTYVCRGCIGACYGSQLQQPIDRLFSRADTIRQRLGWQSGIAHGSGTKPKGMHSKTFDRLVNEHDRLTAKIWQQTLDKLGCTH
ncbi:hypothetical protein [Psychrobacter sp. CMS30]|uniref:hypothetical protein n=1 Tax=Psychrobacter sp. CMS30 TaxID=2774126 RepID=UPI00191B1414|nr:hypothetical protein [Psychrobacter sp. CMS30]